MKTETGIHRNYIQFFEGLELQRNPEDGTEPMELRSRIGAGCLRRVIPGSGMNVVVSDMTFNRDYTTSHRTDAAMVELSYCLQGSRTITIGGKQYAFSPGMCMLQLVRELGVHFEFNGEEPYLMLAIGIPVSTFHRFMEDAAGTRLLDFSSLLGTSVYRNFQESIDPASSVKLSRLMLSLQERGTSKLELECRVLELLSSAVQSLLVERKQPSLPGGDREKIERARDIIMARMADPPSLIGLSRMVGLNDYKLKVGFKEMYGTTVYGYLREKRLEQALLLLQQGGMNVYETSLTVGYSNPSYFAEAFRVKYGVPPGSLVRRSTASPDFGNS
ncbi:MAG: AraC family transcriptional regulator [Paenibacillus sp.]|nr:AraC family transcriptional regulator [Paenibacillus sp.]